MPAIDQQNPSVVPMSEEGRRHLESVNQSIADASALEHLEYQQNANQRESRIAATADWASESSNVGSSSTEHKITDDFVMPVAMDIGMGKWLKDRGLTSMDVDQGFLTEAARATGMPEEAIAQTPLIITPGSRFSPLKGAVHPDGMTDREPELDGKPVIEIKASSKNMDKINETIWHELSHARGNSRRDSKKGDMGEMVYEQDMKERTKMMRVVGGFLGALAVPAAEITVAVARGNVELMQSPPEVQLLMMGAMAVMGAAVGAKELSYSLHPAERRARRLQKIAIKEKPIVSVS